MDKKYSCDCNENCGNRLRIEYYGKNLLQRDYEGKLIEPDQHTLNHVYFRIENPNLSNKINAERIPELISDLHQIYQSYQEVKQELKKQGKLEDLSKEKK